MKEHGRGRKGMERWRELIFCWVELRLFNAFVMLKATFSKHLLVKLA